MALIAVFCTNGINIYAGVNGLEVHQSIIVSGLISFFTCNSNSLILGAILIHNILEMSGPFRDNHVLSIFLMLPFFSASLGLLYHNWSVINLLPHDLQSDSF